MNTEARPSHDALSPSQRSTADRQIYNYDGNKDKLLADLKMVVDDAERLIKETADCSPERFVTLHARFEKKLVETRAKLERTRAAVGEKTQHATEAAHAYVKEHPWQFAGVSAVAGVIAGFLLGRRLAAFDVHVAD